MPLKLLGKDRELLRLIPLFHGLAEQDLVEIGALASTRSYAARDVVVTQGDSALELFAIVRGRLKVVACGPDGRDTVLGIMGEREVFGEVALIDGGPRSATCTALEPCELLVIERPLFLKLLEDSPAISIKLLVVLAQRLRRLSQRSEDKAFLDVPTRLARSLLDLALRFGERERPPSSSIRMTLKLSQQELGDLVDATRESVNKHLNDWTRQGFLQLEGGRMIICDVDNMRRIARVIADEPG
jgi:CRP/FNR family transcriptional regulator, cyclic AMP receptor protein